MQARSQPSRGGFVGGPKGDRVGWGGVCVWGGGGYYYSEWSGGGGGFVRTPPPLATGLVCSFAIERGARFAMVLKVS